MTKRVLSVGQCNLDHGNISRTLQSKFNVVVERADSADEAMTAIRQGVYNLILVNRIFDADGGSGLELIRRIRSESNGVPVMLVSNFEDAQKQAVEAGAVRGFGKAALTSAATFEQLLEFLD